MNNRTILVPADFDVWNYKSHEEFYLPGGEEFTHCQEVEFNGDYKSIAGVYFNDYFYESFEALLDDADPYDINELKDKGIDNWLDFITYCHKELRYITLGVKL